MKKLVVDSTIIIKWLSGEYENHVKEADKLLEKLASEELELFAPELAKYEIGNALLKGKGLRLEDGIIAVTTLYALPIVFVPETKELAKETYILAEKLNISYFDASFIALAKDLVGDLITDTENQKVKRSGIIIHFLNSYK